MALWRRLAGRVGLAIGSAARQIRHPALHLRQVEKVLTLFAAGFSGLDLGIKPFRPKPGPSAYTDTATIYLPETVAEFPDPDLNFGLYKLMVAYQCALIRYGTLEFDGFFDGFDEPELALDLYTILEHQRVEARLLRDYRGLRGLVETLRADAARKRPGLKGLSPKQQAVEALIRAGLNLEADSLSRAAAAVWERARRVLAQASDPEALAVHTQALTRFLYQEVAALPGRHERVRPVHYRGEIRPDRVADTRRARQHPPQPAAVHLAPDLGQFEVKTPFHRTRPVDHLVVRPERVLVRPDRRERGALAPDASDHVVITDLAIPEQISHVTLTEADRQGAVLYPEWHHQLQTYLPEWCALRDRPLPKGRSQYVEEVLARYHGLAVTLRRQFEALRQDPKKLRRQPEGEEVDVDAVVEALADLRAGLSPRENWYATKRTRRRDIAVAFLVDLSGSTGGWLPNGRRIIDVEKEALILLCEALQVLDDRYAIFGFTSSTRRQCDFFTVKAFNEPYDETVKTRLAGLDTFSYTRMGPAIRHATRLLAALDAKVRLLLLITDGKPNDFDGYTGAYAIEDTRQALLEAAQAQVRTFCLTIDSQARQYMPWMFGEGRYTVVDNVATLPLRLPNLYRVLTSA